MSYQKNVVAGLGEIGLPIYQLISKATPTIAFDINPKLIPKLNNKNFHSFDTSLLHVCIPFNKKFFENVNYLITKFDPKGIVIHSTISPGTTLRLQNNLKIPVIYSSTRGVHKRMKSDLKRYTKFFSVYSWAPRSNWVKKYYSSLLKKTGIKTKEMSTPVTLELAKIVCDTSYYGWLINYAQLSNMIAKQYDVNYDEMWGFSDEIHKFLGNRPKMFPGFIGGHCVIPNLKLINNPILKMIEETNNKYIKKFPKAKSINKKYDKSKKKSYSV